MSFLDVDTSGAVEPKAVSGDEEYEIRIVGIEQRTNKNGGAFLFPRFDIPSEPTAKEFTKYLGLPTDEMEEKQRNNTLWGLKSFFDAFEIDSSGQIDLEECIGLTAWAILGVSESEEYGEQNFVKRFVGSK